MIEPQDDARRWMFKPASADRLTTDPLVAHTATHDVGSFTIIAFSTAYGHKEIAQRLGAQYRDGAWYGPAGLDL